MENSLTSDKENQGNSILAWTVIVFLCHTWRDKAIGGFTVTSYAVSRGHPAPLVGKRFLAGRLRVYFCLDSCLVYINFAHT